MFKAIVMTIIEEVGDNFHFPLLKIQHMKSGKNIGIWIDSKEATIIEVSDAQTSMKTLHSNVTRRPRFGGEVSLKPKRRISSASDYKRSPQAHYENEIRKFLKEVTEEIKDTDNLYIFGPAETRIKLESILLHKNRAAHVLGVESCDRITDAQKVKRVKDFFAHLN